MTLSVGPETLADAPAAPPPAAAESPSLARRLGDLRVQWVLAAIIAVFVLALGINVRYRTWVLTDPVRQVGDISNAFRWGSYANDVGYLNVYPTVVRQGDSQLDYQPLRLAVATTWVAWLRSRNPEVSQWSGLWEDTWPLLTLNMTAMFVAAAGMFMLVRGWTGQRDGSTGSDVAARPIWIGLLAATLLWLNPAAIWDEVSWPQWDVWLLPFFVWAVVLAQRDRWHWAGMLLALGAAMKGQILFVAPLFVLWPIAQLRWKAALEVVAGLLVGVALVGSPWLVGSPGGIALAAGVVGLVAASGFTVVRQRWMTRRTATTAGCFLVAAALLVFGPVLAGGSYDWLQVSYGVPQRRHFRLVMGPAQNLPALLETRWRYRINHDIALPLLGEWPLRTVLITSYLLTLVACGIAAGRRFARQDRWFLMSIMVPWVTLYALMPQMHERYLVWAAALSAAWVALGVGPALLHVLITLLAWCPLLISRIGRRGAEVWPTVRAAVRGMHPDLAWAVLLLAALLLYLAVTPRREPVSEPLRNAGG